MKNHLEVTAGVDPDAWTRENETAEHFRCIIGRYKEEDETDDDAGVDTFMLAVLWFVGGVFTGLLLAGIILHL